MEQTNIQIIEKYIGYCKLTKRLDIKTLKAYRIDLVQFFEFYKSCNFNTISTSEIESFIGILNQHFKPKTVKRKIASLKAFFRYLEYKDIMANNPFNKIRVKIREPILLPKIIPINIIRILLETIYNELELANTVCRKKQALLDVAIVETLFSTGMRVSELCNLKKSNVNLHNATICIYGKGSKERIIQISNNDVLYILEKYEKEFNSDIQKSDYFFINQKNLPVSDQSIRRMINKYCQLATINQHITPHMFRHTFATSLLEADVDIRYIQEMLGHSSISVTEIYTHVALSKQKEILSRKHPRNFFKLSNTIDNF